MTRLLIVPGLHDSGEAHWQTWLEEQAPDAERVVQDDWSDPDLPRWSNRLSLYLEREAARRPTESVIVVAHSFGCLAAVQASADHAARIAGLLLVAPADPQRFASCEGALEHSLPVPSLLVASANDAWMSLERAHSLGRRWGSRVINLGLAGHINVQSGFGPWPGVFDLLADLDSGAQVSPFPLLSGHPNRADERFAAS